MPGPTDLHGNAPDESSVVLLLIDVINDLEFEGGKELLAQAMPVAEHIADLKQRAKEAGIPVVYANDNFGRWQSDFRQLLDHCLHDGVCGEPIARLLRPDDNDYFILKPKHSGFYQTALDILLQHLGAETLLLTGFAGDFCVLFTANDAYMRGYKIIVPADCIASEQPEYAQQALDLMERVLKADVTVSHDLELDRLVQSSISEEL